MSMTWQELAELRKTTQNRAMEALGERDRADLESCTEAADQVETSVGMDGSVWVRTDKFTNTNHVCIATPELAPELIRWLCEKFPDAARAGLGEAQKKHDPKNEAAALRAVYEALRETCDIIDWKHHQLLDQEWRSKCDVALRSAKDATKKDS